jgi:hypothetical protein
MEERKEDEHRRHFVVEETIEKDGRLINEADGYDVKIAEVNDEPITEPETATTAEAESNFTFNRVYTNSYQRQRYKIKKNFIPKAYKEVKWLNNTIEFNSLCYGLYDMFDENEDRERRPVHHTRKDKDYLRDIYNRMKAGQLLVYKRFSKLTVIPYNDLEVVDYIERVLEEEIEVENYLIVRPAQAIYNREDKYIVQLTDNYTDLLAMLDYHNNSEITMRIRFESRKKKFLRDLNIGLLEKLQDYYFGKQDSNCIYNNNVYDAIVPALNELNVAFEIMSEPYLMK